MKLFVQAIQAVIVELAGVLVVVWMLFGFAAWGLQSATGNKPDWHRRAASYVMRWLPDRAEMAPARPSTTEAQRVAFVAQRLDHYGHVLGTLSQNVARRAWRDALSDRLEDRAQNGAALAQLGTIDSL
ncbi:MAG: hypothetical protein AB7F89_16960 [Pirellulaceae bacterium]